MGEASSEIDGERNEITLSFTIFLEFEGKLVELKDYKSK